MSSALPRLYGVLGCFGVLLGTSIYRTPDFSYLNEHQQLSLSGGAFTECFIASPMGFMCSHCFHYVGYSESCKDDPSLETGCGRQPANEPFCYECDGSGDFSCTGRIYRYSGDGCQMDEEQTLALCDLDLPKAIQRQCQNPETVCP